MGVGEYLRIGKAEREVVAKCDRTSNSCEMLEKPEEEFAEQLAYYTASKASPTAKRSDDRRAAGERIPTSGCTRWCATSSASTCAKRKAAGCVRPLGMAGSFALGAALPVLPYAIAILSLGAAMWLGLVFAVLALFGIGFYAGTLSGRRPFVKGVEIVAFGAAVFAIGLGRGPLRSAALRPASGERRRLVC